MQSCNDLFLEYVTPFQSKIPGTDEDSYIIQDLLHDKYFVGLKDFEHAQFKI